MIRRLALITSLLVIPALATAQRGGGGSKAGTRTELFGKDDAPKGPALRVRDIEDMSPLKLLIDKRKDLKLTDAQLSAFKDSEGKLKDKNAPLFKAVDSLVREMRPGMSNSEEDRVRPQIAGRALMGVLGDVNANYDAAAKEAVATLDTEQQTRANEMLAKQREEGEKNVRDKMRPAGGSRGGPPPR